jgi:alpha-beta hydrolase superfamily lysophospholipase
MLDSQTALAELRSSPTSDDDVISHHHSIELFESLPQGQLAVIPGTSHLAHKEKPAIFQLFIREFLNDLSYPQTKMPIRRKTNNQSE